MAGSPMTIGLRHLQCVVEATHQGSFRRAANSLHIRQSTLSRTIWQLEDALGILFFVRSSGGARPTSAGIHFAKTAGRLLEDLNGLLENAKARGIGKTGHLTIGLLTFSAAKPLQPVMVDFVKENPDVSISLVEKSKRALLTRVRDGSLDLAIVAGQVSEEDCEILSLWSERILVAIPQLHPLCARKFAHWNDLEQEVVLMSRYGLGPELHDLVTTKLAAFGGTARIQNHAASAEALLSLVSAGLGVTVQGETTVQATPRGVVYLEVHDGSGASWMTYAACWRKEHPNPTIAPFLAHLRAYRSLLSAGHVADTRPNLSAEGGPR